LKLVSPSYSFASAYLKGEEARCVTSDHVEGMLQRTSTVREAIETIRSTDIGDHLWEQPVNRIDELDEALWDYLRFCRNRLAAFRLPRDMALLMDLYLRKYDLLNVKIALRKVTGKELPPPVPMGDIYELGYLDELMMAETVRDINEVLVKADFIDYGDVLEGIRDLDRRSLIDGEAGIDNRYFNHLLHAVSDMIDGAILATALITIIDSTNLSLLFRSSFRKTDTSSEFFLLGGQAFPEATLRELLTVKPLEITAHLEGTDYELAAQELVKLYDKTGMIDAVDRVVEKHKYKVLQDLLSPRVLSPCNLLWYFLLKELEIRNVRLLLKTVNDGVEPSETRDYLVMLS
jgi:vacuolar-type H+-ATPase subunit C/Vma6